MKTFKYFCLCVILVCVRAGYPQSNAPVSWMFNVTMHNPSEGTVHITADVAPGWHLYSQQIAAGGPMPTRIQFDRGAYALTTPTKEKGNASTYYDPIYEMKVISYSGIVHFEQGIRLEHSAPAISGTVEYMVCNKELCVPGKEDFRIDVKP